MEDVKICECCGQVIVDYKVTLTKRNLIWLMALGYIGKYQDGTSKWVNYKDVHTMVAKNFGKWVDGKWKPMVVTSYSKMAQAPWKLIENDNGGIKTKYRSKGDWRLTPDGMKFINNLIQVPEIAHYNKDGCYYHSRMVFAKDLKGVNFAQLVEIFKSF